MKDYNFYQTEDFLADDDFCRWALGGQDRPSDSHWSALRENSLALRSAMNQAAQILRHAHFSVAPLEDSEMEKQISGILNDARALQEKSISTTVKPLFSWKKMLAAASITTIIAGSLLFYQNKKNLPDATIYQSYVAQKQDRLTEIVNEQKGPKTFTLPDLSQITLYRHSKLSYQTNFGEGGKREVYLDGTAFFEVRKDTAQPFFVFANGLLTRVVGTSFQIETTTEGANVKVKTGKVAVMPVKDAKEKQLLLTPNQQAYFSSKENTVLKSIVAQPLAVESIAMKSDFEFINQPMPRVFDKLSEVYGLEIVYDQAALKDCHVDVTLSNEPFFTKLDILCKTIGATYQHVDGRIIITAPGCH